MYPGITLKVLDRHLAHAIQEQKTDPERYTYTVEVLKQLRNTIILEDNLQKINQVLYMQN